MPAWLTWLAAGTPRPLRPVECLAPLTGSPLPQARRAAPGHAASMPTSAQEQARAAQDAAMRAPYEALARRVGDLETQAGLSTERMRDQERQIAALTSDRDDLVAYLQSLYRWADSGEPPPPPRLPEHIAPWLQLDHWPGDRPV